MLGAARERVGEKLAALVESRDQQADAVRLDIERRQFLPAPLTIGVLSTARPHPKIPEFEQLLSAANVAFNLVHGAFALGYGAVWVTRWFAYDAEAARMLGARDTERVSSVSCISAHRPRGSKSANARNFPMWSRPGKVNHWLIVP